MSMSDKKRYLYDDDTIHLQEGSNSISSKAKILCVLKSHELLSATYITHQFTYFIYYSHQDTLKNSRITRNDQVYQMLSRKHV